MRTFFPPAHGKSWRQESVAVRRAAQRAVLYYTSLLAKFVAERMTARPSLLRRLTPATPDNIAFRTDGTAKNPRRLRATKNLHSRTYLPSHFHFRSYNIFLSTQLNNFFDFCFVLFFGSPTLLHRSCRLSQHQEHYRVTLNAGLPRFAYWRRGACITISCTSFRTHGITQTPYVKCLNVRK